MRAIAAIAVITALTSAALAAPTRAQLQERADALEKKLAGQGFRVMIEEPFVLIGDEAPRRFASRANFVRWVLRLIEKDFFAKRPDEVIEIWLFKNEKTYRAGAKKFFDDEPETPYGYYSSEDNAMIMNIGPGAGTLSHELVHPYMEANFPDGPSWFNEGLASLYEAPQEQDGHMAGRTNWRLPGLTAMIRSKSLPSIATLLSTTSEGFYNAQYDSYAYARYICQYLQEKGLLRSFYKEFTADTEDLTGQRALAKVLGTDLASFQKTFEKWALQLRR